MLKITPMLHQDVSIRRDEQLRHLIISHPESITEFARMPKFVIAAWITYRLMFTHDGLPAVSLALVMLARSSCGCAFLLSTGSRR